MKICPKCQHTVNSDYLFCPKCGENLGNCHHCGKELPDEANFCPYCGKSTDVEEKVSATPVKSSTACTQQDIVETKISNDKKQNRASSGLSLIAPKDFFEKNFISNDGVEPIQCRQVKECENDKSYTLSYYLTDTIQIDSFVSILHAFETERICFAQCWCSGFDRDSDNSSSLIKTIEDMNSVRVLFGKPYIDFYAEFCDRETRKYCFSVSSAVNSMTLRYSIKTQSLNKQC